MDNVVFVQVGQSLQQLPKNTINLLLSKSPISSLHLTDFLPYNSLYLLQVPPLLELRKYYRILLASIGLYELNYILV